MSQKIIYFFISILLISNAFSITIDGDLSDDEWSNAETLEGFLTVFPDTLEKPKYKTEVKYFTDNKGIYFGITNYQPKSTQVIERHQRDSFYANADRNYVMIDFDNNASVGYEFTVTLGDSIRDSIFVDENEFSDNWDAIWYAKTKSYEDFWISEYFIPWGVAPLIAEDGPFRNIKISVARWAFGQNEVYNTPGLNLFKSPFLSKFTTIKVKNYKNQTNKLDFFPYASLTNNFIENNRKINIGGEIFWDLDQKSKIDLTLNPDFGQVESDDVIVNFSAIETFYPDKRPFFIENQTLFDVTGYNLRFINTRRIGGIPDKCSETAESHKGECSDSLIDTTDINYALRYTRRDKVNEFGIFSAFEDDSLYSDGRDFLALRYRLNRDYLNTKLGYLHTSVDRPSIDRKAHTHTLDYDLKPTKSSRFYGWISQVDTSEKNIDKTGYGVRTIFTNRFSERLFTLFFLNYLDEDFNINDMGYLEQYGNTYLGGVLTYNLPNNNPNSAISQQTYFLQIGYGRSTQGYGGGTGFNLKYELSFKDSSRLEMECKCSLIRGKDYVETRNYVESPFIESLGDNELILNYSTQRTGMFQHRFKVGYLTGGYESISKSFDLREEGHTLGYSFSVKFSENLKIFVSPIEYQRQSNWNIWKRENLFAYYDKEMISSGLNIDWFIGDRQEIRVKGKIYGIKGKRPRPYRVNVNGYLGSSEDEINSLELSETAFQVRYKYQFAPLSDLYVVYTRGGKYANLQTNQFEKIYSGAWSNQNLDKFIIKLRYKL
ncbi:DUF5916 domain-containing protein [SAR86 cluster bacterium]|nr:DUF5916 domain-containing protein [SAR86 cluster bacterium]